MKNFNSEIFITDTKQDRILMEKSKPYSKMLAREFKKKIAVENYYKGVRFWLWLSLLVESVRFLVLFLYAHHMQQPIFTNINKAFMSLYFWVWCYTAIALLLCFFVHKDPEKYTGAITFVGDTYLLVYLVRGVCLAMLEVESGILGISLITALLIAGFAVIQKPIIALTNLLLTAATFTGFCIVLEMTILKNPSTIFSLIAVAVLSLVLSCSSYHSRYVAFLREKSALIAKDNLKELNIELEKRQEQIELQNEQLKVLSRKDNLTGLRNRHCFVADAKALMEKNYAQTTFVTLAITDIDNFKKINDTYGHTVGDECLLKIGSVFSGIEEEHVHAYRFGGDEFIVLFDGKSRSDAFLFMNRFLKEISNVHIHNFEGMLSASVGIYSAIPNENQSVDEFIEKADKAMYEAKGNGKNRIMTCYKDIKDEMKGQETNESTT